MRQLISFLLLTACLALIRPAYAQVCTGTLGGPVFSETFGRGVLYEPGQQPVPGIVTNLVYFNSTCGGGVVPNHPIAGYYTLESFISETCHGGAWQVLFSDHTGDPHGYMMIITALVDPQVLFTEKVSGDLLCPGTTYQMGAFIMNLLRGDLPGAQNAPRPDVTFNIWNEDRSQRLGTGTLGPIDADEGPGTWKEVNASFVSPTDGKGVIIELVNNVPSANSFSIALDDITVRPCGPTINTGFGTFDGPTVENNCAGGPVSYSLVSKATAYSTPNYKWQYRNATYGDWQNVTTPGFDAATLPVSMDNAAAGIYQYRVGVLGGTGGLESCRIYSDPLTINVYPVPVIKLDEVTAACIGYQLQLSSTVTTVYPSGLSNPGNPVYEWSGPNGFTSAESSPIISDNADPSFDGVYTVKVTKEGCPSFASTKVVVAAPVTLNSGNSNIDLCEGDSKQLSVDASNATRYMWVPSTGLDHDDIPNPIATPLTTTTYTVTISNDACTAVAPYASITINVLKKPTANAGQPAEIYAGQSTKLNGTAGGDKVNYHWTPPDFLDDPTSLTPVAIPPHDITYTLHVASICNEATSDVFVRVYQLVKVPNTFTPNGDGINDTWEIKNLETYPLAFITVYNRNGQLVFNSKGSYTPWNGNYNGSALPSGTYYYVITLQDDLPKQSGWVFISR